MVESNVSLVQEPIITDLWYTRPYVLEPIKRFFGGDYFDPCPANPTFDGLETDWPNRCYINPPYSEKLKRAFIEKALAEYRKHKYGKYLWMLNYSNSKDLWKIHSEASAILIPRERFKFDAGHPSLGNGNSPRYDNIMIVWGDIDGFAEAFGHLGRIYYE